MCRKIRLMTSSYDAHKTETMLQVAVVKKISKPFYIINCFNTETPAAILNHSLFTTKPLQYFPIHEGSNIQMNREMQVCRFSWQ
jgi:hypothetical protein